MEVESERRIRREEAGENSGEGASPAPSGLLSSGVTGLHYWAATPVAGTFSSTWLTLPARTVTLAVASGSCRRGRPWPSRYTRIPCRSRVGDTNTRLADVEVVASLSMVNLASSGRVDDQGRFGFAGLGDGDAGVGVEGADTTRTGRRRERPRSCCRR